MCAASDYQSVLREQAGATCVLPRSELVGHKDGNDSRNEASP